MNQEITVELKNDLKIQGTLHSVDQYLNLKIQNISIKNENEHPHMIAVKDCFIRGSVVRYVSIPPASVDKELLQDASRKEFDYATAQSRELNINSNLFNDLGLVHLMSSIQSFSQPPRARFIGHVVVRDH